MLGSNLAYSAIKSSNEIVVVDNLSKSGGAENLKWLQKHGDITFHNVDIANIEAIEKIIKDFLPDVIFHVAGQVAMTKSIEDPRYDFNTNTLGSFNILEALRKYCPNSTIIYSSTNKVYGDLEYIDYIESDMRYTAKNYKNGFDSKTGIDLTTPYGCSKGAADQYFLDYARVFNLNTVVLRHSTIYGSRQFATLDQGWIGWFCKKAIETKNRNQEHRFTISGNGKQVRDILHVSDAVTLYNLLVDNIKTVRGKVFNVGGGITNSFSLLELFQFLENQIGQTLEFEKLNPRKSDQKFFVCNLEEIYSSVKWKPLVSKEDGVSEALEWSKYTNTL